MALLKTIKGLNPGQIFALDGDTATLGRSPDCDIVLEIGAVSREHAKIVRINGEFFAEDMNSRNGTYVNDRIIVDRRRLADYDQVRVCDLVFEFHHGSPESVPTTKAPALMVDDQHVTSTSTITSKVDISSGTSGLRLTVNAEAKLKALLEIGRILGRAIGLREVLPQLLDQLFGVFIQADRGFIVLKDVSTGELKPAAARHRKEDCEERIRISRTIVNGVMASKEAILSADAATDSRFDMAESVVGLRIHSMMCAPLVGAEERVLGALQIDTLDPRHHFNATDLDMLAAVACQAAIAVENSQLHEMALAEEGLKRELALAHQVQRGFLPAAPPQVDGYEFFDSYESAKYLGGDYYDYLDLPGGRLAVVLADVAGKGTAAALLMAKLSAETRTCLALEAKPSDAVGRLNRLFSESRWEDRFITLVVAVLDPASHQITLINAGHMAPLLRRVDGSVEAVGEEIGGMPLGVDADETYGQCTISLAPGESLFMYTDGITDAMNIVEEFYGEARLLAQLAKTEVEGPVALGRAILDDVQKFAGEQPQTDDRCVTFFGRPP